MKRNKLFRESENFRKNLGITEVTKISKFVAACKIQHLKLQKCEKIVTLEILALIWLD